MAQLRASHAKFPSVGKSGLSSALVNDMISTRLRGHFWRAKDVNIQAIGSIYDPWNMSSLAFSHRDCYHSIDTFDTFTTTVIGSTNFDCVYLDHVRHAVVLLDQYNHKMWYSYNGGASWDNPALLRSICLRGVHLQSTDRHILATQTGIYTCEGISGVWTLRHTMSATRARFAIVPTGVWVFYQLDSGAYTLYASFSSDGVNWGSPVVIGTGSQYRPWDAIYSNKSGRVIVFCSTNCFHSNDGSVWTPGRGFNAGNVMNVVEDPITQRLYAVKDITGYGPAIPRSDDGGLSWCVNSSMEIGATTSEMQFLTAHYALDSNKLIAFGSQTGSFDVMVSPP